ncbi:general secretion pathway protein GspB [Duganella violaceipulchra]|uniref:General secretion pathway protein B n=1 Tax=Duganella violaceipulchra TaxID=2849652 RepID=A0AA41H8I9_9BURK|nr:general secretion pathway protein GspB [Duganella violaceicalia]MBV6320104.1 general secretion pathway protein GspB [Duganella violaceicalia]MCP2010471.1 general secretion pathway protein B [Duganella violaceicalia]
MSYILEALKKAQAERQLGSAPTLHAPTLHGADGQSAGGALKKPVVLALLAMGVAIAVLLALVLRPAQQAAAPVGVVGVAPVAAAAPAVVAAPAPVPAAAPSADIPPLAAALPPPMATVTPAPRPHPAPEPVAAALVAEKAAKPAVAQEEAVQNLRDLPEPIQRSIPHIAVGGYIYSKNPADRLLLIDKILRHEGEEVAPGLILDKLQPREAVFNFKGYRYRVPY